jgi:hypothetical protein
MEAAAEAVDVHLADQLRHRIARATAAGQHEREEDRTSETHERRIGAGPDASRRSPVTPASRRAYQNEEAPMKRLLMYVFLTMAVAVPSMAWAAQACACCPECPPGCPCCE